MSRPRRSEHIREALIQAGIEQLSIHGYHGTGIKQILDQLNVPKGSFYNFFASKEAFVAETISTYSDEMQNQLHGFVTGPGKALTPKQQLQSISEFSLHKVAKSGFKQSCLIAAMSTEVASESAVCREQLTVATKKWLGFFQDLIAKGQQAGEFRHDVSPEQLADLYWATWEGALIKLKMSNRVQPAQDAMTLMLNVLMSPQ